MTFEPLSPAFFIGDTLTVTRRLLGQRLIRRLDGELLVGRIVEAEAYGGREDSTSHAYRGPTPRAAGMFGPPGRSYVYLIYGMHSCLNVVAHPPEGVGAILIRALLPEQGIERMQALRGGVKPPLIASGPGRLCAALAINRTLNDVDLCDADGDLFLAGGDAYPDDAVVATPRVGVRGQPDHILLPWRLVVANGVVPTRKPRSLPEHLADE